MTTLLRSHAGQRMIKAKKNTKAWFFWRGVLLGLEATDMPKLCPPAWADAVFAQKKKSS